MLRPAAEGVNGHRRGDGTNVAMLDTGPPQTAGPVVRSFGAATERPSQRRLAQGPWHSVALRGKCWPASIRS